VNLTPNGVLQILLMVRLILIVTAFNNLTRITPLCLISSSRKPNGSRIGKLGCLFGLFLVLWCMHDSSLLLYIWWKLKQQISKIIKYQFHVTCSSYKNKGVFIKNVTWFWKIPPPPSLPCVATLCSIPSARGKTREFSIQGEGDGTACAVVNQLWA
jgi:hypothetical protein